VLIGCYNPGSGSAHTHSVCKPTLLLVRSHMNMPMELYCWSYSATV